MKNSLSLFKKDLLHLIYPELCTVCGNELSVHDMELCPFCTEELRYTYFETFEGDSPLDKLFWGRIPLVSTFAMLNFEKESSTQTLLHGIKYKNKRNLAKEMGRRMGNRIILNMEKYRSVQALIPVPLHPRKHHIRGYNQSEMIAEGISSVLQIPVIKNCLIKTTHTQSQTKKGRFLRWDNVSEVFSISKTLPNHYQHVALVDDVITTGSTLEAGMQKILETMPDIQLSVLSLAFAKT